MLDEGLMLVDGGAQLTILQFGRVFSTCRALIDRLLHSQLVSVLPTPG